MNAENTQKAEPFALDETQTQLILAALSLLASSKRDISIYSECQRLRGYIIGLQRKEKSLMSEYLTITEAIDVLKRAIPIAEDLGPGLNEVSRLLIHIRFVHASFTDSTSGIMK